MFSLAEIVLILGVGSWAFGRFCFRLRVRPAVCVDFAACNCHLPETLMLHSVDKLYQSSGPKELPRVARSLGRFTGRATGHVYRIRSQVIQVGEQSEIKKVHLPLL